MCIPAVLPWFAHPVSFLESEKSSLISIIVIDKELDALLHLEQAGATLECDAVRSTNCNIIRIIKVTTIEPVHDYRYTNHAYRQGSHCDD